MKWNGKESKGVEHYLVPGCKAQYPVINIASKVLYTDARADNYNRFNSEYITQGL